jgi:hypothetical protein
LNSASVPSGRRPCRPPRGQDLSAEIQERWAQISRIDHRSAGVHSLLEWAIAQVTTEAWAIAEVTTEAWATTEATGDRCRVTTET